ncbi:MAG TPA: serine hydroxymethyltransferase [Anaerohalosphaeraceae bacterium]|nr:serine hydroxymethyltransferase [Phycisphaerae bacterium]HOK95306.1 serine hydroxymethyltransferase [Anaerohalosphaeraceae bacterium]HOL30376.1 serine hydroxymethyltransferase [Anaerohalosphaeraceae bacterium]HOM75634.1 serine hydroxymethyltransferase [Anaerohalosphaeraceae bacterium]HPC63074.1 serine hydroxymethyltransferase [Anaerohalosphaeraceae bacterium]
MSSALEQTDKVVFDLISQEEQRQAASIRMIPSENYVSKAVMQATGSCLTNKYSEGYPGKRYYEGQQITDQIETLAQNRAKALFGAQAANVQPHSGSPANLAAYCALAQPGDTIMGLALPHGGHLTHGWKVSYTGKFFNSVQYELDPATGRLDYDKIADLAKKHRPKILISGSSAYPRIIDFSAFAEIANRVGAYHVSDMAHIAGLVAGKVHPSPVPYADIVTTTTHKTLRGPRGGMILCRAEHEAAVNKAVFPGLQGGPHMHTISALAVALGEAMTPDFAAYAAQIVRNAKRLAEKLLGYGFNLVSGGTDNHLILIDLRNKGLAGKPLAKALDRAHIVCNYNSVPGDTAGPFNPSGLRLGTPAITTRGMKEEQMDQIAAWIDTISRNLDNDDVISRIGQAVIELCRQFPLPDQFVRV